MNRRQRPAVRSLREERRRQRIADFARLVRDLMRHWRRNT